MRFRTVTAGWHENNRKVELFQSAPKMPEFDIVTSGEAYEEYELTSDVMKTHDVLFDTFLSFEDPKGYYRRHLLILEIGLFSGIEFDIPGIDTCYTQAISMYMRIDDGTSHQIPVIDNGDYKTHVDKFYADHPKLQSKAMMLELMRKMVKYMGKDIKIIGGRLGNDARLTMGVKKKMKDGNFITYFTTVLVDR